MDRWWRHCYGKCVKVPSSSNWNSILHTFISQSRTSNNSSVLNWFGWNPICALQLSLHIIDTSVTILKSNHFSSPPPSVCYTFRFQSHPSDCLVQKTCYFHTNLPQFSLDELSLSRDCVSCVVTTNVFISIVYSQIEQLAPCYACLMHNVNTTQTHIQSNGFPCWNKCKRIRWLQHSADKHCQCKRAQRCVITKLNSFSLGSANRKSHFVH